MAKRVVRGMTKFSDKWKRTYPWVEADAKDKYSAVCSLCGGPFSVASMGNQAVKSHAKGAKHKELVDNKQKSTRLLSESFTGTKSAVSENETTAVGLQVQVVKQMPSTLSLHENQPENCVSPKAVATTNKTRNLKSYLLPDEVTMNEVYWCLQTVMTHRSLRDAESDVTLLKKMSTDETIQGMTLSRGKVSYVINHGLAPYFHSQLLAKIQNCEHYVASFDETLNKFVQSQQMDVIIRFWDEETDDVRSRYLTSLFLDELKAENLLTGLMEGLECVNIKKLFQVSMDGPNVNLKVLRLLKAELQSDMDGTKLLEIGSCGIHVVHGAFKTGIQNTDWALNAFLRAIFYLFKDCVPRRSDFTKITGCKVFPLKFCETRWVENVDVVQRAASILVHLKKYVEWAEQQKTKPKCKSYTVVKNAMNDKLLPAKLAFFQTLAGDVEPFLTEFQTDAPMAPFLYSSLTTIVEVLMSRIIKSGVLSQHRVENIDLNKKENLLPPKKIYVGFNTRKAIGSCQGVSVKEVEDFHAECGKAVEVALKKIFERSPLKYPLTKYLSCLDPVKISRSNPTAQTLLRSTLDEFIDANLVTPSFAEKSSRQFKVVIESAEFQTAAKTYKRDEVRLDRFWVQVTKEKKDQVSEFRRLFEMILIMSHGNATIERGFSVNKECIVENQKTTSLIAQRQIYDSVSNVGGVLNVELSKPLLQSARSAHSRYREALDEQKKRKEKESKEEEEKKRAAKELRVLEQKKKDLDEDRTRLQESIDKKRQILKK